MKLPNDRWEEIGPFVYQLREYTPEQVALLNKRPTELINAVLLEMPACLQRWGNSMKCSVYVFAQVDYSMDPEGRWVSPVKVGITGGDDMGPRLATIQTSCPFPIAIVASLQFPDRGAALEAERAFHTTHSKARTRGEWFAINPLDAASALSSVRVLQ